MPWYLRVLEVSRPLHFGDYGGTPLKVIWLLLDVATIAVIGSGIYLWLVRLKLSHDQRIAAPSVENPSRAPARASSVDK